MEGAAGVTAVVVCSDGARWLPRLLRALRAQDRRPDAVVAVDAGSTDATLELLAAARQEGLVTHVVELGRRTGFGAAVAEGVRAAPASGWYWLLHDDCAPAPDALGRLLGTGEADPGVALVGPRLVGGPDGRRLLELGTSTTLGGRRSTGVEPGEVDQGQHEGVRDVLALSTAALLVRASAWERLGGLEPLLPLFRDDLDLGWRARRAGWRALCDARTSAWHAEAARHGLRPHPSPGGAPLVAERRAALLALLLDCGALALPQVLVRAVVGAVGRALGLLLAAAPGSAARELLAVAAVLVRPDRVVRGRWRRRRTARVPSRELRPLLARRTGVVRLVRDAAAAAVAPAERGEERGLAAEVRGTGLLVAVLAVVALWPLRDLLGGALAGGPVGRVPGSLGALRGLLVDGWHPVGLGWAGVSAAAEPLVPLCLAALAAGGSPVLGAGLLVALGVPLAGLTASLALRGVLERRAVRLWAAGAYALLPAATGATAGGRSLSALVVVALPVLLRLAGAAAQPGRRRSWHAAWGAALLLGVLAAAAPQLWTALAPAGVLLALLALAQRTRAGAAAALRVALVLVLPLALELPLLRAALDEPRAALAVADGGTGRSAPWELLLLHPGGPGMAPVLLAAPLVLGALAALLVEGRRAAAVRTAWLLALSGWAAALTAAGAHSAGRGPWTGPALAVAGAGVLLAAATGAEAAVVRLRARAFGWRHPATALVAALALPVPLVVALLWVGALPVAGTSRSPLRAAEPSLPAYVLADLATPDRPRVLVLAGTGTRLRWAVERGGGSPLGGDPSREPAAARRAAAAAVQAVASGQGGGAARGLAALGVRYVVLRAPVDEALRRTLDGVPGLTRSGRQEPDGVWEVASGRTGGLSARLRVTDARGADLAAVPARPVGAVARLAAGGAGRLLVLAEPAGPGWHAALDGRPLAAASDPVARWAQAFALPASGGRLVLRHSAPAVRPEQELRLAGAALLLLLALPLPWPRRRSAS
ncbi:GT2 family glycosyltransferase [Motilibacter rhizosphaerae]|uniref:GT2 family glycosyltransferase n=1 Tax=Motilibacter rhizosphaerae TaxID=598652 RepID=A0A4Q7NT45_9ACTN|nr:glycosyltransferase family 2 protein [Motilibacter rhizosphaerae]RZS90164.1 GT2 family glycosyltransferase [Motilibacter rhizosphaerae]